MDLFAGMSERRSWQKEEGCLRALFFLPLIPGEALAGVRPPDNLRRREDFPQGRPSCLRIASNLQDFPLSRRKPWCKIRNRMIFPEGEGGYDSAQQS